MATAPFRGKKFPVRTKPRGHVVTDGARDKSGVRDTKANFIREAAGKKVYSNGSFAPNKGSVDKAGYRQRELNNRVKKMAEARLKARPKGPVAKKPSWIKPRVRPVGK